MIRPSVLPVRLEGIPLALRAIPRWVLWRNVQRSKPNGSKVWAKLPMTVDGSAASSTDPSTWTDFDTACDGLIMGDYDGLGLVLGADVHGIDLDDCRIPDGSLTALAEEVLDRVQGYAEVSPSGTGIKVFALTNLDQSRTKKAVGVELYLNGRYFTVTGHVLGSVGDLAEVNDLGWLVAKVWNEAIGPADLTGDAGEMALANYKSPLEDWDIDRVVDEVLVHLDPDGGYEEWLKVGMAMHHQSEGDHEWLEAWDKWSAQSYKWVEGDCAHKWASFSKQRFQGKGAFTLASILKLAQVSAKGLLAQRHRSNFALVPVGTLIAQPPEVRYLIDQMLEENSLGLYVGESQTYKSFCAIDICACIATGTKWHGRETLQGSVIYIAGEGHNGISRRVKAWEIQSGVSLESAPLHFSNASISMMDDVSMKVVTESVQATVAKCGIPKLVVVDTVHRNFGGGDENSTKDWAVVFQHLDALRTCYSCTIILVHHTGHNAGDRGRGSSSLRAGMDFEFLFSRVLGGQIRVECTKSKDSEPPAPFGFEPVITELPWQDRKGRQMTSLVLREIPVSKSQPKALSGAPRIALEALRRVLKTIAPEVGDDILPRAWADTETWRAAAIADGLSDAANLESKNKAFRRARQQLLADGFVMCSKEKYSTND